MQRFLNPTKSAAEIRAENLYNCYFPSNLNRTDQQKLMQWLLNYGDPHNCYELNHEEDFSVGKHWLKFRIFNFGTVLILLLLIYKYFNNNLQVFNTSYKLFYYYRTMALYNYFYIRVLLYSNFILYYPTTMALYYYYIRVLLYYYFTLYYPAIMALYYY